MSQILTADSLPYNEPLPPHWHRQASEAVGLKEFYRCIDLIDWNHLEKTVAAFNSDK
jgi:hypothetical protein